jgi:N-acetylglucosaminyldiphosphoundecaprenol N-acetyl-beta-D-mannosaminyltransferase
MGVKISNVGYADAIEAMKDHRHEKGYVCLNDVGNVMAATKDSALYEAINDSLLSIADGAPLAWYGKLLGCTRINRIAGFELMKGMLESHNGFKHYLLGDTEQTISKVIEKAKKTNNSLQIAGHSPPFRQEFTEEDNQAIFRKINKENPDFVWVSFGGGKQEKWMHQNVNRLKRGVMVGVGAAFKFYIGDLYIPPKIAQQLGMQWFFRMLHNPVNFAKRAVRSRVEFVIHFPCEVIKARKNIALH